MTTLDIDATVIYTGDSDHVRPKLPVWSYEVLKSTAKSMNRKFTRGMVASEALFLYGYPSRLTQTEETIDRQLDFELGDDVAEKLNNIRVRGVSEGELLAAGDIDGVDDPEDLTDHQIDLWFPQHVSDNLPGRGIGREIADAILHFYTSPYRSISDRVVAKAQILDYVQIGKKPSHPVARAMCLGKDDQLLDVPDVPVGRGRRPSTPTPESNAVEWWESDDVTFDDLKSRTHTADGDGLSQKQGDKRIVAMETAIRNDEMPITRADARIKVKRIYGIQTESTIDDYVEAIDSEVYAEPLDKQLVAKTYEDNLDQLEDYAGDVDKQAEAIDTLLGQYYEETGDMEFNIYNVDAMENEWLALVYIMVKAGWVSQRELPDSALTFFRDHVRPIFLDSDYIPENAFATSKQPDRIIISEDWISEDSSRRRKSLSNVNLLN